MAVVVLLLAQLLQAATRLDWPRPLAFFTFFFLLKARDEKAPEGERTLRLVVQHASNCRSKKKKRRISRNGFHAGLRAQTLKEEQPRSGTMGCQSLNAAPQAVLFTSRQTYCISELPLWRQRQRKVSPLTVSHEVFYC